MEVMYTNPTTGVHVEMGLPQEGDLDPAVAEMISRAVAAENMKPVTPEDLVAKSAAAFVATVDRGQGREIAGFLRQLEEPYVVETRSRTFCLYELGTLWVNPQHRGREYAVADTMVRYASWLMSRAQRMAYVEFDGASLAGYVPHLPVAVCNPDGGKVFDRKYYQTVGQLPHADNRLKRDVKLCPPGIWRKDQKLRNIWQGGAREEVIAQLGDFPRFAGMTALAAV